MVADWLASAGPYGVNARLATLPLDGSDAAPTPIVSILDETRHVAAAFSRFDGVPLPALLVGVVEDPTLRDGEILQPGDRADGTITVAIRYAARALMAPAALADAHYVAKAVLASLRRLHDEDQVAARTRNGVRLVSCERLQWHGIYEEIADAWVLTAVSATYYVSDRHPYGE